MSSSFTPIFVLLGAIFWGIGVCFVTAAPVPTEFRCFQIAKPAEVGKEAKIVCDFDNLLQNATRCEISVTEGPTAGLQHVLHCQLDITNGVGPLHNCKSEDGRFLVTEIIDKHIVFEIPHTKAGDRGSYIIAIDTNGIHKSRSYTVQLELEDGDDQGSTTVASASVKDTTIIAVPVTVVILILIVIVAVCFVKKRRAIQAYWQRRRQSREENSTKALQAGGPSPVTSNGSGLTGLQTTQTPAEDKHDGASHPLISNGEAAHNHDSVILRGNNVEQAGMRNSGSALNTPNATTKETRLEETSYVFIEDLTEEEKQQIQTDAKEASSQMTGHSLVNTAFNLVTGLGSLVPKFTMQPTTEL